MSFPAAPLAPSAPAMSFPIDEIGEGTVVLTVGKALDFRNAAVFKQVCQEKIADEVRHFILDFSDTGILDSTGLGSIFSIYRQVTPSGGKIVFASVSRPVQVVVQLTRTYKVFNQYASVDEARASLGL